MEQTRLEAEYPDYWCPDMATLINRRAPMPEVQRWQSTYVRYHGQHEGQVTQSGWELTLSQAGRHREETVMAVPSLATGGLPTRIAMCITAAPAEFAVPVKQDRRLTPDFKLRVEVSHRGRVCFPLTIRAHILSQQEKDNLPEWRPEGMVDFDAQGVRNNGFAHLPVSHGSNLATVERKVPTELKGTTYITHHFESNRGPAFGKHDPISRYQAVLPSSIVRGGAVPSHFLPNLPHVVPSTVIQTPLTCAIPGQTYLSGQDGTLIQGLPSDQLYMTNTQQQFYGDESAVFSFGNAVPGNVNEFQDPMNFSHMIQDILDNSDSNQMQQGGNLQAFERQQSLGIKTEHFHREFSGSVEHKPAMEELINIDEETMVHEFEFANLEFLKPTRMSKVYICFACTILDCDLLYCVYHIPTVGICRAEQRLKASDKLSIPRRFIEPDAASADGTKSEGTVHSGPIAKRRHHDPDSFDMMKNALVEMEDSESRVEGGDSEMTLPYSRQALRDWIREEYETTGLKRRLTELDMQTLESQAGFPIGGGATGISINQWNEFTSQFRDVLSLLKRIASVWDNEDPCVISGFHLDRRGTVQALMQEPAGTFVCRLSWSMPGTLVLSCKVRPEVERADNDGLIHAVIRIDDLQERRVDTWIRDFPSATHVLDVYTQRRVDKRKVFHAKYTRMKHMEDMFNTPTGPTE